MRILAVDASTQYTFLVLCVYDEKWGVERLTSGKIDREHDNWLELLVREFCLETCGIELKDLDGFAAGYGPGSFTSLRINFTYLKTLAILLDKIFLTFSTSRFYHSMFCRAGEALLVQANRNLYFSCDPDQPDKVDNIRPLSEWSRHYAQNTPQEGKKILLWNQYPPNPNAPDTPVAALEYPEIDPGQIAPSASVIVELPQPDSILKNKQEFMNAMPFYGHDVIINRKL